MLNIWFIDDNENFMDAMKRCLSMDTEEDYGIFDGKIGIKFLDPGIDGSSIVNTIQNASHDSSLAPDIIFLDLRYPADKRNAMTETSDNADPLQLSGMKILDAILHNDTFNSCYPIIFSEVSLNETHKNEIIEKYNYLDRSIRFIEKNSKLQEIKLKIDGINSYVATKNCDTMKAMIRLFRTK